MEDVSGDGGADVPMPARPSVEPPAVSPEGAPITAIAARGPIAAIPVDAPLAYATPELKTQLSPRWFWGLAVLMLSSQLLPTEDDSLSQTLGNLQALFTAPADVMEEYGLYALILFAPVVAGFALLGLGFAKPAVRSLAVLGLGGAFTSAFILCGINDGLRELLTNFQGPDRNGYLVLEYAAAALLIAGAWTHLHRPNWRLPKNLAFVGACMLLARCVRLTFASGDSLTLGMVTSQFTGAMANSLTRILLLLALSWMGFQIVLRSTGARRRARWILALVALEWLMPALGLGAEHHFALSAWWMASLKAIGGLVALWFLLPLGLTDVLLAWPRGRDACGTQPVGR